MKFFVLLSSFILYSGVAIANNCIANPPIASVNTDAAEITEYLSSYLPDEQIMTESFKLQDVGEVLVMFESCQHLVFTVVFLITDPFNPNWTEIERYSKLISALQKIPFKVNIRFSQLLRQISDWAQYSLREEHSKASSYFSWRRSEETFSDYMLRNDAQSNGSRLRFDLNISL